MQFEQLKRRNAIDRRELVGALAGASLFWPSILQAQQGRRPAHIGLRTVGSTRAAMTGPEPQSPVVKAFLGGMRELGYVYGRDFVTEPRGGAGMPQWYADLVAELIALSVDVVVASGPMLAFVKAATTTIPIVMAHGEDPLGEGLIQSLAHPGGNFTGLSGQLVELNGKRLELLRELVPGNGPLAVIWDALTSSSWRVAEEAAVQHGWTLLSLEINDAVDIEPAFKAAVAARADGLLVTASAHLFARARNVADLATKSRLPTVYQLRAYVDAGGLMSYAPSIIETWRHAASYVEDFQRCQGGRSAGRTTD
jgi:ABC-type uncharacterized transport system substrate-binding protein